MRSMVLSAKPAWHQGALGIVLIIGFMSGFVAPAGKPGEKFDHIGAHIERWAPVLAFQPKQAVAQEDATRSQPAQAVEPAEAQLPTSEELSESITPPVDVEREIEGLRSRLRNAEMAILSRDAPLALELMGEVESGLASLQREHGDDIPAGHVGVLVLEEKLVYLKREARQLQANAD